MSESDPNQPFYLIVTDHDRGVFAVEGPMMDDLHWQAAVREARQRNHRITCGPAGPDRDALAAEYRLSTTLPACHPAA